MPVSSSLRRDIGIWAGIVGIFHAVIGQNVHLRGRPWLYCLYEPRRQGPIKDVKTVQELLPYANSRIALGVYTQAVNSDKRVAQSKAVKMMISNAGTKVADVGTIDSTKRAQNAG